MFLAPPRGSRDAAEALRARLAAKHEKFYGAEADKSASSFVSTDPRVHPIYSDGAKFSEAYKKLPRFYQPCVGGEFAGFAKPDEDGKISFDGSGLDIKISAVTAALSSAEHATSVYISSLRIFHCLLDRHPEHSKYPKTIPPMHQLADMSWMGARGAIFVLADLLHVIFNTEDPSTKEFRYREAIEKTYREGILKYPDIEREITKLEKILITDKLLSAIWLIADQALGTIGQQDTTDICKALGDPIQIPLETFPLFKQTLTDRLDAEGHDVRNIKSAQNPNMFLQNLGVQKIDPPSKEERLSELRTQRASLTQEIAKETTKTELTELEKALLEGTQQALRETEAEIAELELESTHQAQTEEAKPQAKRKPRKKR